MNKPSKIVFIDDETEESFNQLKNDDFLKKAIIKVASHLKQNAFSGIQISKKLIPKVYIRKYKINNLWKQNMPKGWRLLYTITADNEVELITAILEWLSHKDYERRFKY
jgi:Txe/YoeB family toxin of Txe-Axe toxin-antitoxin module